MFEEFDGFVYECKKCGIRFFQEGKPINCCNSNEFYRMTFEQAIGLEKREFPSITNPKAAPSDNLHSYTISGNVKR